jgi:pyridoxal 5'-phosphate synthase pdxS subunit
MRSVQTAIREATVLGEEELVIRAKELGVPVDLLETVRKLGKLPVPNFAAGGVATPADASLMMQLGAESIFVGSGIFKSSDPEARARAIVLATTHYDNADMVAKASEGLLDAMPGLEISKIPQEELMAGRGW